MDSGDCTGLHYAGNITVFQPLEKALVVISISATEYLLNINIAPAVGWRAGCQEALCYVYILPCNCCRRIPGEFAVVIRFRHLQQSGNTAQRHHFAGAHIQIDNCLVNIRGFDIVERDVFTFIFAQVEFRQFHKAFMYSAAGPHETGNGQHIGDVDIVVPGVEFCFPGRVRTFGLDHVEPVTVNTGIIGWSRDC